VGTSRSGPLTMIHEPSSGPSAREVKSLVRAKVIYVLVVVLLLGGTWGCTARQLQMAKPGPTPVLQEEGTRAEGVPGIRFLRKPSPRHIRVMSYNVNWDSIFPEDGLYTDEWRSADRSTEFERILRAIAPDLICLQEINPARDPQQVADILDAVLPLKNGERWRAHSGQDNVIVTRFGLEMRDDKIVHQGSTIDLGHAMALVNLPDEDYDRDIYVICAHFKSQGGQADIEARQRHADVIIEWMRDIQTAGGEISLPAFTPIILLGDFNVYNTDPAHHLTTLITGDIVNEERYGLDIKPDWDSTDLGEALPRHNGVEEDIYTWRDDTQQFDPGVLDRILYTDSVISVENSFVLNTMTMTKEELDAAGLAAGDVTLDPQVGEYDHLPLAVDILFQDNPDQGH
jgi:endonuclease/exonuclease/phosphatase family metal-dependent hydrolase